jgi:hypothetical protein
VNSNSLTITVPALSTTAILLKASSVTYVTFNNRATGMLMDGMYRFSDGSLAGQWHSSGSTAQQWSFETTGSYVKIKNRASGLYLDGNGSTANGVGVVQKPGSSSNNQQWSQEAAGSYVKYKNRATGQYLDGLGTSQDGADLSQWQTSNSSNQQWSITTALLPDLNSPEVSDIKFYPNPFVSNFKLEVPDSGEPVEVVFFDMNGRAVETTKHSGGSNALTLGAGLKPGLYVVKVKGKTWAKSIKVFKK